METVLYALLFVLIGVVGWLLWDRSVGSAEAPRRPQTVYIQQEAPVQQVVYTRPRFWDAWWPSTWWGSDIAPWNYRYSYNRLYDWGWPWYWKGRGSEEVHPSRWPSDSPDKKPQHKPTPVVNPTIHIQLPPPVNTVTQPTQAPPTLPTRSPLPEPIPTIHSGPTAPPAAPSPAVAPVQVQTPEMFVPASPSSEPPSFHQKDGGRLAAPSKGGSSSDKGYTLVTSFPDQEPLPLPTVS